MSKVFNWGIIGCGYIAHQVMKGMEKVPNARLLATASLTPDKAEAFSKIYSAQKWYSTYAELVRDPDIDIVYVATTHPLHMENTILALENGKPVLCEKPIAVNASQTQKMIDCAKSNNLFLMEAMWSRYFPVMSKLRDLLSDNIIGELKVVTGDFSYNMPGYSLSDKSMRMFDPDCAGGGLIDVGIYPLSFACMVFGKTPIQVTGLATMTPLNVDAHSVAVFGFEGGGIASVYSGIDADSGSEANIYGSNGRIRVPNFWHADTLEIFRQGSEMEKVYIPYDPPGFQYELMEVQKCIAGGMLESPIMPLQESLNIIKALDDVRAIWNLKYPME